MKFYLFGTPRLFDDDFLIQIKLRKTVGMLAFLAVTGQPHSRDKLATLFWPEMDQSKARANLRRELSRFRSASQQDLLITEGDQIGLNPEIDLWLDVREYERLLGQAKSHGHLPLDPEATGECPDCLKALKRAVELYTDDFMAGFSLPDSTEFDDWQFFQSESLRQSLADALQVLIRWRSQAGALDEAIVYARRWLALDNLHEPAHRALMQLYAWSGQQAAALRQYQECVQLLEDELGVEPEPETTQLYEDIRARRVASLDLEAEAVPAPGFAFTPESQSAQRPLFHLPAQTITLLGREHELEELQRLLLDPDTRLVTIIGLGGAGKTQLALETGRRLLQSEQHPFQDGAAFVPLAGVESGEVLPVSIAEALNLPLSGQADPLTEVSKFLQSRHILLILDNFEQLVEHADALAQLLDASSGVKLLVTSREPLQLISEWRFNLEGLAYPAEGEEHKRRITPDGEPYGCVQLFVQAARKTGMDFQMSADNIPHVCRLCRLVSGMPLAVQLAASWLRAMPVEQLAEEISQNLEILSSRMRDVPPRQRSMRAIFESTWSLLSIQEQNAFQALSVFRKGFRRQAAEEITRVSTYTLASLVDRGLINLNRNDRYEIHELMRQFAAEKLAAGGREPELSGRHSRYYLSLAAEHRDALHGKEPFRAASDLKSELDNLRKAWHWALHNEQQDILSDSLEAVADFYELANLFPEGQRMFGVARKAVTDWEKPADPHLVARLHLKEMLFGLFHSQIQHVETLVKPATALVEATGDDLLHAELHRACGHLHYFKGEMDRGIERLKRAVSLYEHLERERPLVPVLNLLGLCLERKNRLDEGRAYHHRALEIARKIGDLRQEALALTFIGGNYYYREEYRTGLEYFQRAIPLLERMEDLVAIGRTENNIGFLLASLGEHEQAKFDIFASIAIFKQLGDRLELANSLSTLAYSFYRVGLYKDARKDYQRSLEIFQEYGLPYEAAWMFADLAQTDIELGDFDRAKERLDQALETMQAVGNPVEVGRMLGLYGFYYASIGDAEAAEKHFEKALDNLRSHGSRHMTADVLIQQANFVFESGDDEAALEILREGRRLAEAVEVQPLVFQAGILEARILKAQGRLEEARERLELLRSAVELPIEQAAVHDELWQVTRKREHGQQALALYRSFIDDAPTLHHQERLDILEREFGEQELEPVEKQANP